MIFYAHANKTLFHKKVFVLSLGFSLALVTVPEVLAKVYSAQFPSRLFSLMVCFPKVGHVIKLLRTVSFKFRLIPTHMYAQFMTKEKTNSFDTFTGLHLTKRDR